MSDHALKANSLSYFESMIMGVAGTAPGFSIAATVAALIGTAGFISPGSLIYFAIPMLGIAFAYKALNKKSVHAGAAYQWTGEAFGSFFGFFSGWALLVASIVFMVAGSLPLATSTLDFVAPHLSGDVFATALTASLWFLIIGIVLMVGIQITSRIQVIMTTLELLILAVVAGAAFTHTALHGAVHPFSLSWFSLDYSPHMFASTALVVVFFYWGWDVTANLGEETAKAHETAGNGGIVSVLITVLFFVAFTAAALLLFSMTQIRSDSDNIIYNIALASGLGKTGAGFASFAVILSSIATLETTMLQFSRTLFAMGRDGAMSPVFGKIARKTQTPVKAMLALIILGMAMIWGSSFIPSISDIIRDSVNAVGFQVIYYYGFAGLTAAFVFRKLYKESVKQWLLLCIFPAASAVFLFVLALYSISTFSTITNIVGLGGLALGIFFFRPKRIKKMKKSEHSASFPAHPGAAAG